MNAYVISICLKSFLFLLLVGAAYFLIYAVVRWNPAGKFKEKLDDMERKRLLEAETGGEPRRILSRYLDRLDERLTQAGIKKFLPKAGVELYFLFNVLEFTLVFCLMEGGILIPLLSAGLAVYLNHLLLDILRYRNKKRIEKQLLEFMNLVSDYAASESEITMILYRSGRMLQNPLKDLLLQVHMTARNSGDTSEALAQLRRSVDHFLFQEIILLLELCSKSDNDYQRVVNSCREMVNRYLKEEKEKASVVRGLVLEAGIMTGVAVYGISTMLREFAGGIATSGSMAGFFFHEPAGQISLVIYAVLAAAMVQVILKFAKR